MEKISISKLKCRRRGRAKRRGWSKLDFTVDEAVEVESMGGSDDYSSVNSLCSLSARSDRSEISIVQHESSGAYIASAKDYQVKLVTRCTTEDNYGEETFMAVFNDECCKFRNWSPHQSKLAAAFLKGVQHIQITEGTKVLYLGLASGCSVSHVADIVGDSGIVYAVETSSWAGTELLALSQVRRNVVAIIDNPMLPYKYRRIVADPIDFIFCDTMHQEQLRILIRHARHFLKPGGNFAIMLPGEPNESIVAVNRLHAEQLDTLDQISLKPYVHGQFMLVGVYNQCIREALINA